MFQIGNHIIDSRVLLAPMAGVTDLPFRRLCRRYSAGLTTTEMLTSQTKLWDSKKSLTRLALEKQSHPVSMQIAGSDPSELADAAQQCVALGAQIIDINMGCPAKKVCKKLAGSALLENEALIEKIINKVVHAVDVPVTLKTRTGTNPDNKNGLRVALLAQDLGIRAIAIHGRTRACRFQGQAEYETIKAIAQILTIPVIANGDIQTARQAAQIMSETGASAVMIGRAALGQPWLLRDISHYLQFGNQVKPPELNEKHQLVLEHIQALHEFYGDLKGLRIARKHFAWYCEHLANGEQARKKFNQIDTVEQQLDQINQYFHWLKLNEEQVA